MQTHPVIQQVLDTISPRTGGFRRYEWHTAERPLVICFLEYEPAERGARENGTGLQLEPDAPESLTLHKAYSGFDDIYNELSASDITEIEALALAEVTA